MASGKLVCVTGAGGFIASWLVKHLLQEGYVVRGTLRDPENPKNAHLKELEGAKERLALYKADLMNYDSLCNAFKGCDGVFHVASPLPNELNLVPVAIEGTKNVVNAAADMNVRRIVFTSSYGAVHMDPNRSPDKVLDETCWSDTEFCLKTKNWYCYGKTLAEKSAMAEAKRRGVQLLVVAPPFTLGPTLSQGLHSTGKHLTKYMTVGTKRTVPNAVVGYIDVRDVAQAHELVYKNPKASGRYLCIGYVMNRLELIDLVKERFPHYPFSKRDEHDDTPIVKPYKFSNQRIKDLGLRFTPIKETLSDTVVSLQEKGHLPIYTFSKL
ncbi:cinnamoyl coa reductase [Rhynchospora pubera]|uniref:Cinnamoyl coa reductase n=1 Tax=Rhynchospora pubera TaxID=906938 RepID=A0AAV8GEU4_9POAL|nr:cinnamoyl coa reductase [Rhynchospora pubera]